MDTEIASGVTDLDAVPDRALAGVAGARWFFAEVVEPLCDSFDPDRQARHDELLSSVITACARRDAEFGRHLARRLRGGSLLDRRARTVRPAGSPSPAPDLCLLPSRVTIGADVAITATVAAHLRAAWPQTRIVLAGSAARLAPLSAGGPDVEVWDHEYPRHGTVRDRLAVWLGIATDLDTWRRRHPAASVLVLDPDSRMTQLGLLPLVPDRTGERVFASRGGSLADRRGLTELAGDWARQVTGRPGPAVVPDRIRPPERELAWGAGVLARLRAVDRRPVVLGSLGVGGNPRKATTVEKESEALARVTRHASVILDAGGTPAEVDRADAVTRAWVARTGGSVQALPAGGTLPVPVAGTGTGPRLVRLAGAGLSTVAGLLVGADLFVGYDSAGQHIAAAVGTPGVVVFVDPPSPTFVDRWRAPGMTAVLRPAGPGAGTVARVEAAVIAALPESAPGARRPVARTPPGTS